MSNVVIVGGGLFGSITAHALAKDGHSVLIVDDERPFSGSAPSGMLIKPSWIAKMSREYTEASMSLLSDLFGVRNVEFRTRPANIKTSAYHVARESVFASRNGIKRINETVTELGDGWIKTRTGEEIEGDCIIVAAGSWCNELLGHDRWHVLGLKGKYGLALRYQEPIAQPFISVWAPYKQIVAFRETEGTTWAGDGSAIIERTWTPKRQGQSVERVRKAVGLASEAEVVVGIRPYLKPEKGAPCSLKRHTDKVWSLTGGAKNGTIAAGWAASVPATELVMTPVELAEALLATREGRALLTRAGAFPARLRATVEAIRAQEKGQ